MVRGCLDVDPTKIATMWYENGLRGKFIKTGSQKLIVQILNNGVVHLLPLNLRIFVSETKQAAYSEAVAYRRQQ